MAATRIEKLYNRLLPYACIQRRRLGLLLRRPQRNELALLAQRPIPGGLLPHPAAILTGHPGAP